MAYNQGYQAPSPHGVPPQQPGYYNDPSYQQQQPQPYQQEQSQPHQQYPSPPVEEGHVNIYAPQPGYAPSPHPPITLYYGYQQDSSAPYVPQSDNAPIDEAVEKPKCQDACCAVFFLVSAIVFFALMGYGLSLNVANAPAAHDWQLKGESLTIFGLSIAISTVVSLGMLLFIQSNAACMIWTAMFLNSAIWIVTGALLCAYGVYFGAINIFFGLMFLLYPFCLRARIAFVATMIKHSTTGLMAHKGVFGVAILTLVLTLIPSWAGAIGMTRIATYYNTDAGFTQDQDNVGMILLIVSFFLLYWICEFLRGFLHTVVSGVVGTWWYMPQQSHATGASFRRAATTSMGSIAFGTLLVSICHVCRMIARMKFQHLLKNSNGKGGGALIVLLIIIACIACIFSCFEGALKWINHFAFTHCALYGTSYIESGKRTVELFFQSGFLMIVQKDLTGFVVGIGVLFSSMVSAGLIITLFWALKIADFSQWEHGYIAFLCTLSVFLAIYTSTVILTPLTSAVTTTFITWSEDPNAMEQNHAAPYQELSEARSKIWY